MLCMCVCVCVCVIFLFLFSLSFYGLCVCVAVCRSLCVARCKQEFGHWMLPREGVMNSYVIVVCDVRSTWISSFFSSASASASSLQLFSPGVAQNSLGEVTDLISFYTLPSTIIGKERGRCVCVRVCLCVVCGCVFAIGIASSKERKGERENSQTR